MNDGGDPAPVDSLIASRREAFGDRIRVIHNAASKGMEAASNVGLRAASGRYVVIHDDDDSWNPTFLEQTVAYLAKPPGPPGRPPPGPATGTGPIRSATAVRVSFDGASFSWSNKSR